MQFFITPGNGPVLLGILDCKKLQSLSMNFDTRETDQHRDR